MTSLRKNLIYNTILTSAYYVFPLIVYPYISRVLGVANIGLVGFIDSIATYFILFSMMGISIVGVREIARCGEDLRKRKEVFCSLLGLHGIMTAGAAAVMVIVTVIVPELRNQWQMMGVGLCKLIFNLFLIEWFYRGIEDFRYITIRSLVIRGLYVVSVFVFVRSAGDTFVYYLLTMLVVAFSALVNMWSTKRFLTAARVTVNIRRFISPFFTLGAYELLGATYTTFNTAFLGFVTNDTEVGYYATASKVISIITMIYISFSGVLLPRMSSLAAQGNMGDFKLYLKKAALVVLGFSIPVVAVIEVFTPGIIMLLSGPGYEGAITPLRIMIPFLLVLGLEQLLVVQTFMPLGRIKKILLITLCGALTGVTLNILLVPHLGAIGSAWVWGIAETVVLICAAISFRHLKTKD